MTEALKEARRAADEAEVPVGCVIVHEGRIVGRAHNQRERLADPTAHAEMIAITQAASALERWRLSGCTAYVTIEPCAMCAGALVNARVRRLVFGARDLRFGGVRSKFQVADSQALNHRLEVVEGVLPVECVELLREFFEERR
jgi:tRNA(adenine34) deaminase